MIKIDDKSQCSGCGTCVIVCPKNCIQFSEDEIGAKYPVVDVESCINCGKCEAVCPIQNSLHNRDIGKAVYAAYSNESNIRFRGSSGGMFETFATKIIEDDGSVFASKFDDYLKLKCVEATTIEEIRCLTKSKYLQSDCASIFPLIKQRIIEGRQVLFCATPCQVSALEKYLGDLANYENVFLLDFFCHGISSQSFFDKCIEYIEERNNIKILEYQFRVKLPRGATPHYYSIKYRKNGVEKKKTALYTKDPYYLGFQKYITLRNSCYHCPFGTGNHCGDITIGDFHDIERYITGINRFDGVSTVIINSEKGQQLWNRITAQLTSYEFNLEKLYKDEIVFAGGTIEPKGREEFLKDIKSMDFSSIVDKWLNSKKEWKKELYYSLPTFVRRYIKRIARI